MPNFGQRSKTQLTTCDERLRTVLWRAIEFVDFAVIEGYRNEVRQNDLFYQGLSKLRFPYGKHNQEPSLAVDIIPWPSGWSNLDKMVELGRFIQGVGFGLGFPIRWGGDWDSDFDRTDQTFHDLAHVELIV